MGKDAIRDFVRRFEGVPPGRLVIHHQVATDQVVMNERTDHITRNGRSVVLPICGVFEIRDGRIATWREYFDLGPVGPPTRGPSHGGAPPRGGPGPTVTSIRGCR